MGLLTWRNTRKIKHEVRDLKGIIESAARGSGGIIETPKEAVRRAALNQNMKQLTSELRNHGFRYARNGIPWGDRDRVVRDAAIRHVINDGMSIVDAVNAAALEVANATLQVTMR